MVGSHESGVPTVCLDPFSSSESECLSTLSVNLVFEYIDFVPTLWLLNASSGASAERMVISLNAGEKTSYVEIIGR